MNKSKKEKELTAIRSIVRRTNKMIKNKIPNDAPTVHIVRFFHSGQTDREFLFVVYRDKLNHNTLETVFSVNRVLKEDGKIIRDWATHFITAYYFAEKKNQHVII